MPRIPIFTAQSRPGSFAPVRFPRPDNLATQQAFANIGAFSQQLGQTIAFLEQREEEIQLKAAGMRLKTELEGTAINTTEKIPIRTSVDIGLRDDLFDKGSQDALKRVGDGITSNRARRVFRTLGGAVREQAMLEFRRHSAGELTSVLTLELGRQNAIAAQTSGVAANPEVRDQIRKGQFALIDKNVNNGLVTSGVGDKLKLDFDKRSQEELLETIASADPLSAMKMNRAGAFNLLDPAKRENTIVSASNALASREKRQQEQQEREVLEVSETIQNEIQQFIAKRDLKTAQQHIDFAARFRLIKPEQLVSLRRLLTNPGPITSNTDVVAPLFSDLELARPTTTLDTIDVHFRANDITLDEMLLAKQKLRTRQESLRDTGKNDLRKRHEQAEQMLRAETGVARGIVASALSDDPGQRVFAEMLSQLTKRSNYFDGDEDPITIVHSLIPTIREAVKGANLKPREIDAMFPSLQQLERARDRGRISEEQFDERVRARTGVVPVPSAAPRFRNRGEAPTRPSPAESGTKTKRKSRSFGTE